MFSLEYWVLGLGLGLEGPGHDYQARIKVDVGPRQHIIVGPPESPIVTSQGQVHCPKAVAVKTVKLIPKYANYAVGLRARA